MYYRYTRISLVFLATALILIAFCIKRKQPRVILIISDTSLGIYVIHIIILYAINKALNSLVLTIHPFLLSCITFIGSPSAVYFLKNYAKKLF